MKWIPLKGLKKNELPQGEVLVTNNATSTNSSGGMSHIWIAYVYKEGKEYVGRFIPHGVMGTVTVNNITHYCLPIFKEEIIESLAKEISEMSDDEFSIGCELLNELIK